MTIGTALALLLTLGLGQAPNPESLRQSLREAWQAKDTQRVDALAKDLVKAAPDDAQSWLLAGLTTSGSDAHFSAHALGEALKRGLTSPRDRAKAHAIRAELFDEMPSEAQSEIEAALSEDPTMPGLHTMAAAVYVDGNLFQHAREEAERAVRQEPNSARAHHMLALALAGLQLNDESRTAEDRAVELGLAQAEHDQWLEIAHESDFFQPWMLRAAVVIGALFCGVLLAWLSGFLLSRWAARVPLTRDASSGRPAPSEQVLLTLYRAQLAMAVLVFYVALPVGALVTLGSGLAVTALLAGVFDNVLRINLLVIASLVATVTGTLGVVLSAFRPLGEEPDAVKLTPDASPALFELVTDAARIAASRSVDELQLCSGAGISVHESGRALAVLFGRGRRVLRLGLAALEGLTVAELKAVLCHEFGHFSHGETRLGPVFGRVHVALAEMVLVLEDLGIWTILNPAYWFFVGFRRVYTGLAAGHSRRCEFLADLTAAQACGSDVFRSALTKVIERGELFEQVSPRVASRALTIGRLPVELYSGLNRILQERSAEQREQLLAKAIHREPDRRDSHPPPAQRFAAIESLRAASSPDTRPSTALLPEPDALGRTLTRQFLVRMQALLAEQRVELATPARELEDRSTEWVVQLAALGEQLDQTRAAVDGAGERLLATLADISGTIGADDVAMVPLLLDASQALLSARAGGKAIEAVREALRIVDAQPESDTKTLRSLEVRGRLAALEELDRAQLATG